MNTMSLSFLLLKPQTAGSSVRRAAPPRSPERFHVQSAENTFPTSFHQPGEKEQSVSALVFLE